MMLTADLYFSFRSPYSYLSVGRYRAMSEKFNLTLALRPVYPLAIRQPDFFEKNHPNWLSYTIRDMMRVAQFHDIPFGAPRPGPEKRLGAAASVAFSYKKVARKRRRLQKRDRNEIHHTVLR